VAGHSVLCPNHPDFNLSENIWAHTNVYTVIKQSYFHVRHCKRIIQTEMTATKDFQIFTENCYEDTGIAFVQDLWLSH